jgi:nitroreductase
MFIHALEQRYATKQFDTTKKITKQQLNSILEAGRLAPSSYGLQPYRFVVVESLSAREALKAFCFHQPQIVQASHLVLIQARKSIDVAFIEDFIALIAQERSLPLESLNEYRTMMINTVVDGHLVKDVLAWSQRQAYIALGFMLFAAALEHIDACPMEGFIYSQVDDYLKTDSFYQTTALLTLGYRDQHDSFAQYKKVRRSHQDLIVTV